MARAPGPRTRHGKNRSKLNALKHGIFSSVVLADESSAEFASLSKALLQYFKPEGAMENLLVEKMAMILWRHRRLVAAEAAEIQNRSDFLDWDQQNLQREEAVSMRSAGAFDAELGLIGGIRNPEILCRCLELLNELREGLASGGFCADRDLPILRKIYGDANHLSKTLYDDYYCWRDTAELSDQDRQEQGCATPEQCKEAILIAVDAEIRRGKRFQKESAAVEAKRTKLEVLRHGVPESSALDRLLRYEASLERAFDRALSQLERLQRIRLGQAVLPPVRVQVET